MIELLIKDKLVKFHYQVEFNSFRYELRTAEGKYANTKRTDLIGVTDEAVKKAKVYSKVHKGENTNYSIVTTVEDSNISVYY